MALRQLAQIYDPKRHDLSSLVEVNVAGEQLRIDRSVVQLARDAGFLLDNQYGPTETHVATAHRLGPHPMRWPTLPPIGREVDNNVVLVLDRFGQPVPSGVVGELYIGGHGVATGYLDDVDTTEAFTGLPLEPSIRLYRTGDFGWRDEEGQLHYAGRRDEQVKVRGYRVEVGEIEAALAALPGIREGAVRAIRNPGGDLYLAAYFSSDSLESGAVWQRLANSLPPYLVPAPKNILRMDNLPLTSSGKVNKSALPTPQEQHNTALLSLASLDHTQVTVTRLLAKELDLEVAQMATDTTVVDLGGDSLQAIRIILSLEQHFGVTLPLRSIMRGTVLSLSNEIVRLHKHVDNNSRSNDPAEGDENVIRRTKIPNGSIVSHVYEPEIRYLYNDVFDCETYFQSGVKVESDGLVIDIGAHVGLFSLQVLGLSSAVRVIAVEPAPQLFACLTENLSPLRHRVSLHSCAIGDARGSADLTYYPLMPGMSTLHPSLDEERSLFDAIVRHGADQSTEFSKLTQDFRDQVTLEKLTHCRIGVEVLPLGDVLRHEDVKRIELLKIDAQKSELAILRGINSSLWARIRQVVVEAHDVEGRGAQIEALLETHGFTVSIKQHPLHPDSVVRMIYAQRA